VVARGVAGTAKPGGVFTTRKVLTDAVGKDTVAARAARAGESCRVAATI
jgi:hypothetical protein